MVDPTIPLECPYCDFAGDSVIKVHNATHYLMVICQHCWATGPRAKSFEEAVRLWNQAPRRRLLGR
jgi:hypothetical protein